MQAYSFQIQIAPSEDPASKVNKFMKHVDSNSPIPEPLEGGDGNGCLYECVIESSKKELLLLQVKNFPEIKIYTSFYEITVDPKLYRSTSFVHWNFGKDTSIDLE
jgi:hypothetical protein